MILKKNWFFYLIKAYRDIVNYEINQSIFQGV